MHTATLFGNLQSFMRQALDQAVATQALWHTLSSRPRVSSRPKGRSGKGSGKGFPSGGDMLGGSSCLLYSLCQFPHLEVGVVVEPGGCEIPLSSIFTYLLSTSSARSGAGSGEVLSAELTLSSGMSDDWIPMALPSVAWTPFAWGKSSVPREGVTGLGPRGLVEN